MVAIEFAASCSPLRKSNASATTIRPIRTGRLRSASMAERDPSQVVGDECVYFVRDIFEAVDDLLEVIVKLGSDQEIHRVALSLPIGKEQRLAPLIVKLVGMLLDADDRLGELVELAGILADRAEQRHRLQYQVCRLHDDLAHLLHLDLETADLEQGDVL